VRGGSKGRNEEAIALAPPHAGVAHVASKTTPAHRHTPAMSEGAAVSAAGSGVAYNVLSQEKGRRVEQRRGSATPSAMPTAPSNRVQKRQHARPREVVSRGQHGIAKAHGDSSMKEYVGIFRAAEEWRSSSAMLAAHMPFADNASTQTASRAKKRCRQRMPSGTAQQQEVTEAASPIPARTAGSPLTTPGILQEAQYRRACFSLVGRASILRQPLSPAVHYSVTRRQRIKRAFAPQAAAVPRTARRHTRIASGVPP